MPRRFSHPKAGGGRVAVLAAASALTGALPIPIIPRRIRNAVRGALAHDLCAQYGIALSAEARHVLASPDTKTDATAMTKRAIGWAAARALARFPAVSPVIGALGPVRAAYDTLSFGRLLERYLDVHRPKGAHGATVRMDLEEAVRLRTAIDKAAIRVALPGLELGGEMYEAPEDHRDAFERAFDTALIGASRLPEAAGARLDAALDEVLETTPEAQRP